MENVLLLTADVWAVLGIIKEDIALRFWKTL